MKLKELRLLIKEELNNIQNEIAMEADVESTDTNLDEDLMMADPVSLSFFLTAVAGIVSGFSAAIWKGMKDNEKDKLKKAAAKFDQEAVKKIAQDAVDSSKKR